MTILKTDPYADRLRPKAGMNPVRQLLADTGKEGFDALAGGFPDPSTFDIDLSAAWEELRAHDWIKLLYQYGGSKGKRQLFQEQLPLFLQEVVGIKVENPSRNIAVIPGSQFGIYSFARIMKEREGGVILCPKPYYLGVMSAWKEARQKPNFVFVDTDGKGIVIESLQEKVKQFGGNIDFFYDNPNFTNPTGVVESLERRLKAIDILHVNGIPMFEDDPYHVLAFPGCVLPPSYKELEQAYFSTETPLVTYAFSFSKLYGGGLRTSVLVGPEEVIERQVEITANSMIMPASLPGIVIANELAKGKEYMRKKIAALGQTYFERYQITEAAFQEHMSDIASHNPINGSFFLWVNTPGIDTGKFQAFVSKLVDAYDSLPKETRKKIDIERCKVIVVPGTAFGGTPEYSRWAFSELPRDRLPIAVEKVRYAMGLFRDYQESKLALPFQI